MLKRFRTFFGLSLFVLLVAGSFAAGQSEPASDQTAPAQTAPDQTAPAAETAKPTAEQAQPSANEAKPAPEEAKPAGKQAGKQAKPSAEPAKPEVRQPHLPSLPAPVTGNALTVLRSHGTTLLFSFMGMGAKKSWDSVTNNAFYLDPDWDQWYPLKPVPGTAGRVDASAIAAHGDILLFGGAVVDGQNREIVVPDVNRYAPSSQTWSRGEDMPVPVAYSVIGIYRDRYIYLLGGLTNGSVAGDVQIYDTEKSRWMPGTPLPGQPVFGHAGAVMDDEIVFVDGAYKDSSPAGPRFVASDQCWMGKIDRRDPTRISWSKLPPHPGTARFGIAAGASDKDRKIYFSGGTANPAGDTGLGFDGKPATPSAMTFAWDARAAKWEVVNEATPNPTMNTRVLLVLPDALAVAGGVDKGQTVSRRVTLLPLTKPK